MKASPRQFPSLHEQQVRRYKHQPALEEGEEVSANEDLMREHGLSKRVILAYDKVVRRIQSDQDLKWALAP